MFINGISVVKNPRSARLALGVCPQFTAIESELTVREHLEVYGRLKGLRPGEELHRNVEALLRGTSLQQYADRFAARLSGGNQRKLALAIALMGNPAVVLIDEFSSGVDAKMKRDMWDTLRSVAGGKAIVITTRKWPARVALISNSWAGRLHGGSLCVSYESRHSGEEDARYVAVGVLITSWCSWYV